MFQNQSNLNQKLLNKVLRIIFYRYFFGFSICIILLFFIGILMLFSNEIIGGTVILSFGIIFLVYLLNNIIFLIKSYKNKKALIRFFDYDENCLKVRSYYDDDLKDFIKLDYNEDIKIIEEYKIYLFIYISIGIFVMEKDKMIDGNFYDLRTFLNNKLNKRYKVMYKEKQSKKTN
jgi:hypothetical protein